jgi:hypothetical protein
MMYPRTDHLVCESSLRTKEIECRTKLKELQSTERSGLIDLFESMRSIAHRHLELGHYHQAEMFWRRVVTCSVKIPHYQPAKVLSACLWIINSIRAQGRFTEARRLHRGLHQKIMKLTGPEHESAIFSRGLLANLHNNFGEHESDLATSRELLQICLLQFGLRNRLTLEALLVLARALASCCQYREAETILFIRWDLDREITTHADREVAEVENAVISMDTLAYCLKAQRRYDDSAKILDFTEEQFKGYMKMGNGTSQAHYILKAELLRVMSRLRQNGPGGSPVDVHI